MHKPYRDLLSKQGRIVIALGRDLMGRQVGNRIPTVQEYAEYTATSAGTIQNAQNFLQEQQIVKLQSRGHQGTYLIQIDRRALWRLIHPGDLAGAMPLPYSVRYEGLATALSETFEQAGISLNLLYMRGSENRLRALTEQRCDFAVISAFAAHEAEREGAAITAIFNLGSGSYVSEHVLIFRQPGLDQITDGMRVGIDPQSSDQAHMTRRVCENKQVELVEISYMQLPAALQRGLIDATVWNKDELERYADLYAAPYPSTIGPAATNTEAAIVTLSDASYLAALLAECLDIERLRGIQMAVLKGERLPRY